MIPQTISHYRILEKLGSGGMGEVYLAEDTQLDRNVAIKFLPAESTTDEQAKKRLVREARAAAKLDHQNICSIYEVAEAEQQSFIVMQYIEGETLASKMQKKPLELKVCLEIAVQVADALAEAHSRGIIHRDIKPQNIMITARGQAKVMDFGLAKVVRDRSLSESEALTESLLSEPGTIIGTVPYMSPEQVRAEPIDARSDIFSFGSVMYEMVTGHRPFADESAGAVLSAILSSDPVPITRYSPDAPGELHWILTKALRKHREERYQTAKDLLGDLSNLKQRLDIEAELKRDADASGRGPLSASASATGVSTDEAVDARTSSSAEYLIGGIKRYKTGALVALAMTLIAAAGIAYFVSPEPAIDSIAVLPFVNQSNDPNTEYLSDGISDSIINRLSQLTNLRVISLSSVLRYKGQPIDPLAVGRELKVRAVLIGRMTQRGPDLAVSTELVDARDNRRLWGEQYNNRQLADLLPVQEEIAREISTKLRLRLSGEEQKRLAKRETENSEAYQLYLQGRFYWNKFTEDGFRKSIAYFNQAVDKDPGYGLAYSGLADSYSLLGELSYAPPKEVFPQARAYAEKALQLDEMLPAAHISLGIVKLFYDWDLIGAEKALRRAKELNPNNSDAYHFYGHYLQLAGRSEEAVSETKRGVELDPTKLVINAELGWAYYAVHQPDQAIAQGRKTLELDPNFVYAYWIIAQACEQQGRYQEAIDELNKARPISADWSWIIAELGYAYAALGNRAEAQKITRELNERMAHEYIDPVLIAYIYVALGEKDQAFAWLDKGYQERSGLIAWLKIEPKFDPIRADARFDGLLQRIRLSP